ncbi:hypothetical protein AYI70_g4737 [Smittium culicis]|uniref:Uncharacterized protein n=1 Tax=Smittium culicis TaxID=133412 RepID=A0A1R1X6P8_9FUNG|nr:hypothetical protein AYI70_g10402 [Smittium culicis]OMJ19435.1 hypothetical protein AYI70_g4737 [Smittium culicis]
MCTYFKNPDHWKYEWHQSQKTQKKFFIQELSNKENILENKNTDTTTIEKLGSVEKVLSENVVKESTIEVISIDTTPNVDMNLNKKVGKISETTKQYNKKSLSTKSDHSNAKDKLISRRDRYSSSNLRLLSKFLNNSGNIRSTLNKIQKVKN